MAHIVRGFSHGKLAPRQIGPSRRAWRRKDAQQHGSQKADTKKVVALRFTPPSHTCSDHLRLGTTSWQHI